LIFLPHSDAKLSKVNERREKRAEKLTAAQRARADKERKAVTAVQMVRAAALRGNPAQHGIACSPGLGPASCIACAAAAASAFLHAAALEARP
jgi:hypothetical protein